MRRLLAALVVLALLLAASVWALLPATSEPGALGGTLGWGSVEIDGLERRYEYYLPAVAAEPPALLFVIHGSGMDAAAMRAVTFHRFAELADRDGFIVVYPEGFEREWNGCRAPGVTEADRRDLDDVGFMQSLIESFAAEHEIDRRRVYATGFSNGGQMAYRLATDAPDRFAAVAAVVAHVPEPENSKCTEPRGPIPVLIMSGTDDPIIPFEGGIASFFFGISARGRVTSALASAEHWKRVNGVVGPPEIEHLPDRDPDDGSRVERRSWRGGRAEVVLVIVHGGGHALPGGIRLGLPWLTAPLVGATNQDVRGADEIWRFLRRQRLPG